MNSKIYGFAIMLLLLLSGMASAFEFDNVKRYDAQKREVIVENSFGLGRDLAKITLISEQNVYVMRGKDKQIAEIQIETFDAVYPNALQKLELFKAEEGLLPMQRGFKYKVKVVTGQETYNVNGKNVTRDIVSWNSLQSNDMIRGSVTIGIFTDVMPEEKGEWIPTFFGVRIDEWATWTEGFNTNLRAYWKMNETAGSKNDSLGMRNISLSGGTLFAGNGLINATSTGDGTNRGTIPHQAIGNATSLTFAFWINRSSYANGERFFGSNSNLFDMQAMNCAQNADGWCPYFNGIGGNDTIALTDGRWHLLVMVAQSGGRAEYYVDNVLRANNTAGTFTNITNDLYLGAYDSADTYDSSIKIDEVGIWNRTLSASELTDLYNAGAGITYQSTFPIPTVSVALNSPGNAFASVLNNLTFNASLTPTLLNVSNATLYIWHNNGSLRSTSLNNSFASVNVSINVTFFVSGISDGSYLWNVYGAGSNSSGYTNLSFASSNRTFSVDGNPPVISMTAPSGIIPYHSRSTNLSVNWTVSDTIGTQTCIISWNNVNSSPGCQQNTSSINITAFTPQNLIFYANDTAGNLGSANASWNFSIFELSRTFNANTSELSTETFSINANYDNVRYTSISSNLVYENISYTATQSTSGSNVTSSRSLQINTTGGGTVFRSFYWNFLLSNATATVSINTTSSTQQITNFSLDDCTTYGNILLNLTMYDEGTRTRLLFPAANNSIELQVRIGNPSLSSYTNISFNKTGTGADEVKLCTQNQFNVTYRMDATFRYSSTNRVVEYYNIQNYTLSNSTSNRNISLYDLAITDSQEFQLAYKDENLVPVSDALIELRREYTGLGTDLTVEAPLTDTDGKTILHLVLSDVIYNIFVWKNGELLATYSRVTAYCNNVATGDCKINLNAAGSNIKPNSFLNNKGLNYRPYYDMSSRTYSFIFNTLDGSTKTIALNVSAYSIGLNNSICYTSLTASSGTLTCQIPQSFGNGTGVAKVTVGGSLVNTDTFNIKNSNIDLIGALRYFFAFLILMSIPGAALGSRSSNPATFVFLLLLGFIFVCLLLLIDSGGWLGVSSAITWFALMIIIILWTIHSKRER